MRKGIISFLICFTPLCFAKTGYVDMVEAINKTKQGAKVTSRLEKDLARARQSTKAIEKRLKKEKSQLDKDIPLLSEQKRAERIQQFQKRVMESQKQVEGKKMELQKLEEQLMAPVVKKLERVISEVAIKEGYTVVEAKDKNTLWVSPSVDLTKKVYTRFNKQSK